MLKAVDCTLRDGAGHGVTTARPPTQARPANRKAAALPRSHCTVVKIPLPMPQLSTDRWSLIKGACSCQRASLSIWARSRLAEHGCERVPVNCPESTCARRLRRGARSS